MKCEGTVVHYWCKCSCGFKFKWASQPFSKRLAAASFYVGGSPTKLVRLLNQVGVVCFTTKTYDNIQSAYLVPAVRNVWKQCQNRLLAQRANKKVKLAGDARCDSPGFCAKHGSNTLMDGNTGEILFVKLVQVVL